MMGCLFLIFVTFNRGQRSEWSVEELRVQHLDTSVGSDVISVWSDNTV